MYIFKNIGFRPIEKKDLERILELHNDDSTFLNLATIDLANFEEQERWWKNMSGKANDKRYAIVKMDSPEEIIGRLRIQNIDVQNRNCEVGLDILPQYRKRGFGKMSYEMVLEFLFEHYNMNMVYIKVADFNPDAKILYEKVGFKPSGKFPDYLYRHGRYWDYLIMAITKADYRKSKTGE